MTLEQILAVIPAIGFEQLTLQAVASALNVTPPALYRHVQNKSDLEVKFVEYITRKFPIEPYRGEPWAVWADHFSRALYQMYFAVPGLADFSIRKTLTADSVLVRHETSITAARHAGFDEKKALYATRALIEFVASWVARAQRREAMLCEDGVHPDDTFYTSVFQEFSGRYPGLERSLEITRDEPPSRRFDFTLDALIRGLLAQNGHSSDPL